MIALSPQTAGTLRWVSTQCVSLPVQDYRGIADDNRMSTNITNQSIIRRFNHHSTMVLRACQSEPAATATSASGDNGANGKMDVPDAKGPASRGAMLENGRLQKSTSSRQKSVSEPVQKKVGTVGRILCTCNLVWCVCVSVTFVCVAVIYVGGKGPVRELDCTSSTCSGREPSWKHFVVFCFCYSADS